MQVLKNVVHKIKMYAFLMLIAATQFIQNCAYNGNVGRLTSYSTKEQAQMESTVSFKEHKIPQGPKIKVGDSPLENN